ncbi:MAG: zinc-dependent alcohol dehydrogenase family protein [Gammaproteobacteria bacterium]|nr:zinc-dependent alcohol dehydrogenase family protein [Gammaproteobacteria bacterium]
MRAMHFVGRGAPLVAVAAPLPDCAADEVLVRVSACGVCRTDLHIIDGELTPPKQPLILGHEIVGRIVQRGNQVAVLAEQQRVGIPWLGATCEHCQFCTRGLENLCDHAEFTGFHRDGGYAEYVAAKAAFTFPLSDRYSDTEAAPLLCAGLIGYRAMRCAGDGRRIGLVGFGAAAHLIAQVLVYEGREVYAFTRPGDDRAQSFARTLGVVWAGDSLTRPPVLLDALILFASLGSLVPFALSVVAKGGRVVCGGIHMSTIPSFDYSLLWGERKLLSIANLTRHDALEFLALAPRVPIKTQVEVQPLAAANRAIDLLRQGGVQGAIVLDCR